MQNLFFMRKWLDVVSNGNFFTTGFAIALRVLAAVVIISGLTGFVGGGDLLGNLSGFGIVGGILFLLFFMVGVYMVAHTILIRASDIAHLPAEEFPVISISAILLKLIGETYACLAVAVAIGGGILTWFAGSSGSYLVRRMFSDIPLIGGLGGAGFLGGLIMMITGVLFAFLVLLVFYLLSESIVVLVEIAKNTRGMRQGSAQAV